MRFIPNYGLHHSIVYAKGNESNQYDILLLQNVV